MNVQVGRRKFLQGLGASVTMRRVQMPWPSTMGTDLATLDAYVPELPFHAYAGLAGAGKSISVLRILEEMPCDEETLMFTIEDGPEWLDKLQVTSSGGGQVTCTAERPTFLPGTPSISRIGLFRGPDRMARRLVEAILSSDPDPDPVLLQARAEMTRIMGHECLELQVPSRDQADRLPGVPAVPGQRKAIEDENLSCHLDAPGQDDHHVRVTGIPRG